MTRKFLSQLQIPLPPLKVQKEIVAEIEGYRKVIDANRELITHFERKIQTTLARVWGEEPDDNSATPNTNPSTGVPFEAKMPVKPRQIKSLASTE